MTFPLYAHDRMHPVNKYRQKRLLFNEQTGYISIIIGRIIGLLFVFK